MGYNTDYQGQINLPNLDIASLRILNLFFGQDKRDLVERGTISAETAASLDFYHFNLMLAPDLGALVWDESEKTYGMLEMLNFLQTEADLNFTDGDFMLCQGEEMEDRYKLQVEQGRIVKIDLHTTGDVIECPSCEHRFTI